MSEENKVLSIQVTEDEARVLIEILNFSTQTANMLATKELQEGAAGASNALRFNRMAQNAQQFAGIITDHIDIGEPEDGQVH